MVNPLDIEVKQTGNAELQYFMGRRVDILPNSSNFAAGQPSTLWNPQFCWEWRSYIIYITPLSFAFDIRIRGEFRPPALAKDTDPLALHPLMVAALSYATAALVGGERINASYVQNYGDQAVKTLDDIAAELVRQQQGTSSRVGKMNNRGRGGRRGWYQ